MRWEKTTARCQNWHWIAAPGIVFLLSWETSLFTTTNRFSKIKPNLEVLKFLDNVSECGYLTFFPVIQMWKFRLTSNKINMELLNNVVQFHRNCHWILTEWDIYFTGCFKWYILIFRNKFSSKIKTTIIIWQKSGAEGTRSWNITQNTV